MRKLLIFCIMATALLDAPRLLAQDELGDGGGEAGCKQCGVRIVGTPSGSYWYYECVAGGTRKGCMANGDTGVGSFCFTFGDSCLSNGELLASGRVSLDGVLVAPNVARWRAVEWQWRKSSMLTEVALTRGCNGFISGWQPQPSRIAVLATTRVSLDGAAQAK